VTTDPEETAAILRRQLARFEPDTEVADPVVAHAPQLKTIRGIRVAIEEVRAKFKYGGNVDAEHRRAVIERLEERHGPGDLAAAAHVARRLDARD
jgi:transcriptional regulator